MTEHLFVYGTLAPGRANAHILEAIGGSWAPATVRGYLRKVGWGAALGDPAMVPDESAPAVSGFIFSSDGLAAHWRELDDFEGREYERVRATARRPDDSSIEVQVYVLRKR